MKGSGYQIKMDGAKRNTLKKCQIGKRRRKRRRPAGKEKESADCMVV